MLVAAAGENTASAPVAWTGWRGANRDGVVPWLPDRLPAKPAILWRTALSSQGIGGVAATTDRVLVSDRQFNDTLDMLRCLDSQTGRELWSYLYPAPGMLDYGNSARSTPLIEGDKCWLLGAQGHLTCVDLRNGQELWQIDVTSDFGLTEPLKWGLCGSPLLADGKLLLYAGGPQAALVALDPHTGKPLWKTPGRPPGYGSLIAGVLGDIRQVIGHDDSALCGWDLATGKRLWKVKPEVPGDFNVPTPVIWRGHLLISTENNGTRMFRFGTAGQIDPQPIAQFRDLAPDTHSPLATANRLFGADGDLLCLDLENPLRVLWRAKDDSFYRHTSLIASPDRLLVGNSAGELLLYDAQAKEPQLLGRLAVIPGEEGLLSHPAVVGKRLYLRGASQIVCVNLDGETEASKP